MTVTGWASVADELRAEMSPADVARRAEERADRQAGRDEAERAAAAEDEREKRAFRFRAMGIVPGQALADAARCMDEDGEYEAARSVMERIERRRESRRRTAELQAEQLAAVSRSGQPAGIDHANAIAARMRVERMLAAPARPRARRPFAVRSAVRSEQQCAYCAEGGVDPETSFLLHSDPDLAVPVTTAEQATAEDLDEVRQETGRHRPVRHDGREITR